MGDIQRVIIITNSLWIDILEALESASLCEHDEVRDILARINKEVES